MGDPFSVTTGAFGVISLGITVCGGIIRYCSAVEGADDEVSRIAQKAERMQKTMRLLRKLLQDSVSLIERDYIDHCQQMVGIIEAGIDNLQVTVVRCWGDPHAASSTRLTMRHTAKKALYPFRQKTLVSVSNAMDSLQLELSTALHMAQTQILNASTAAILARNLGTQTNMEQRFANLEQKLDKPEFDPPRTRPSLRLRGINRSPETSLTFLQLSSKCLRLSQCCKALFVYLQILWVECLCLNIDLQRAARIQTFVLVYKLAYSDPNSTSESAVNLVNTVTAQLYQLYDEGKAQPSDIDPEGRSILHILCIFKQNFDRFPDANAHYSQLISHFAYGDHLAEPDQQGKTPMDYLVTRVLMLNPPALMDDPISTDKVCQGYTCLDVSDFAWAMLRESQFALESAVESAPDCIYTDIGYISPLQLATTWPEGLEFLLGKGEYTIGDIHLALGTAISNNMLDSVQLLFRADVPLPWWMFCGQFSIDMQDLLIVEITQRRAELRYLAESVLITNDLARFQLTKGQLPDRIAASMYITEIREEEKLLLEDLEILVSEFEHRYVEMNIPLLNFLRGYWSTRMKEVLFQRKDPSFEIVKEAKQIGIQLSWEPIDDFKLLFERPCIFAPRH
ncbi:hypothetical protein AARAC_002067 [Aspergillus arachidicola]|uniref:Fungal N-terminal domain-containing protein n=1 Tax=Aspergillus arachidicola TaxID=656916 RepID=A0A2G7G353_9EURO|nr:hypothetical protein AARAC_002067 [Aspergillus arachidicola]